MLEAESRSVLSHGLKCSNSFKFGLEVHVSRQGVVHLRDTLILFVYESCRDLHLYYLLGGLVGSTCDPDRPPVNSDFHACTGYIAADGFQRSAASVDGRVWKVDARTRKAS